MASVTVPNDKESIVCVHPYPIDTDDPNVQKDPANNALYFPVTNDDFMNGRKRYKKNDASASLFCYFDLFFSFLLTRKKLVQSALKLHGPLRIVGSGKKIIIIITKQFFLCI